MRKDDDPGWREACATPKCRLEALHCEHLAAFCNGASTRAFNGVSIEVSIGVFSGATDEVSIIVSNAASERVSTALSNAISQDSHGLASLY